MKSLTNKLLLINVLIFGLMLIMHFVWDDLDLKDSYYAIPFVFIYGLSSIGIGAGYIERKNGVEKTIIGIIGNVFFTLIISLSIIYIAVYYTWKTIANIM